MKHFILFAMMVFAGQVFASGVDLEKSQLNWRATKVTGEHAGTVGLTSASLEVADGVIKSGELIVAMDSITVGDLSGEYKDKFLNHMKSAEFFDVTKFPTAKLVIKDDDGKKVKGELTIKDKTNPVEVTYQKSGKTYEGTLTFDRTKFNVVYGSGNFFKNLGDKMIHDEVTLKFKVVTK